MLLVLSLSALSGFLTAGKVLLALGDVWWRQFRSRFLPCHRMPLVPIYREGRLLPTHGRRRRGRPTLSALSADEFHPRLVSCTRLLGRTGRWACASGLYVTALLWGMGGGSFFGLRPVGANQSGARRKRRPLVAASSHGRQCRYNPCLFEALGESDNHLCRGSPSVSAVVVAPSGTVSVSHERFACFRVVTLPSPCG